MAGNATSRRSLSPDVRHFLILLACLVAVMAALFHKVFLPDWVLFNNDGPLGANVRAAAKLPDGFTGMWIDLNWLGSEHPATAPDPTMSFMWLAGPLIFAKFWSPLSLVILGLCAWVFFRELKFAPLACVLGGLAAALNSDPVGNACWGQVSRPLTAAASFLALAALQGGSGHRLWIKTALAGMAVGWGVMEGFDIGALFSVFVAAYLMFQSLACDEGAVVKRVSVGVLRLVLIAGFAGFLAAQTVSALVGTQIKGITGTEQDQKTKAERWDFATQWSAPKSEVVSILVPGVFGFRMDSPDGAAYWGKGGRDPAWERYFAGGPLREGDVLKVAVAGAPNLGGAQQIRGDGKIVLPVVGEVKAAGRMLSEIEKEIVQLHASHAPNKEVTVAAQPPRGFLRYGSGGGYAGVLVVVIALWAAAQSFRKQNTVYSTGQRRMIWFWLGIMGVSLLLAFGRFAPFYQIFYALPYASTIRNPAKFMHVFQWALVILFAYGADGICRTCLSAPATATRGLVSHWQSWWSRATAFDRKWVIGSLLALGASLIGWLTYISSRSILVKHLQEVQFDEAAASAIAGFSFRQVGWFILVLALALGLISLVLSGYFNGRRARVAAVLLGLFLLVDLARINWNWVVTYNWKEKYVQAADNGVIQFLRQKPHENRVAIWPFGLPAQFALVQQVYQIEWLQHLFQYYNIQSPDIIQMPRVPQDVAAFEGALVFDNTTNTIHHVVRRWQLTNTRYLIGAAGLLGTLNSELDPQQRFKLLLPFEFYQTKAGGPILARTNSTGPFALFEFTGALPRAKLYSHWQVSTNDEATLKEMASKEFDPAQTVLVADPLPSAGAAVQTNSNAGTVDFVSYAPKHIVLRAKAAQQAVLLLNDKYDPNWKVWVDGKPAALLRCNYVMRGVYLEPNEHTVEFRFQPPVRALYVSLSAIALGFLLLGLLIVGQRADGKAKLNTAAKLPAKSK